MLEALIGLKNDNVTGKKLRYHLTQVVFAFLGQQINLDPKEKSLGLKCFQSTLHKRLFILGILGNTEWFDVINPIICRNEPDDISLDTEIIPFFRSVQESRAEKIYSFFYEKLGSEQWNNRIIWCLNSYKGWQNENAKKSFIWLCHNSEQPWYSLELALHNIAEVDARFGLEILSIILKRLTNQWLQLENPLTKDVSQIPDLLSKKDQISIYLEHYNEFQNYVNKLLPNQISWLGVLAKNTAITYPGLFLDIFLRWLQEILLALWLCDRIQFSNSDRNYGLKKVTGAESLTPLQDIT
jgi:hypothetical protein